MKYIEDPCPIRGSSRTETAGLTGTSLRTGNSLVYLAVPLSLGLLWANEVEVLMPALLKKARVLVL